jgi:hypothetical protein
VRSLIFDHVGVQSGERIQSARLVGEHRKNLPAAQSSAE